jgi:hypothetical protein
MPVTIDFNLHPPNSSIENARSPLYFTVANSALTDNHLAVLREIICRNLEVEGRRTLSYAARNVVVGSVAGAEPAAKVAGLANGHTSKMGADTCA